MPLQIFNTLTRRKEKFAPLQPKKIGFYVCGPTVYNFIHVGNARAFIVFDVICRYLRFRQFDVLYVRNYTDVDDKIIQRAKEEGVSAQAIVEKYIQAFEEDAHNLKLTSPDVSPRATQHIAEMIQLISRLIDKGHAYVVDGDVYYAVRKFKNYGKLSGKNIEELEAGARVEVGEKKKDPLDFALWKKSKAGEPSWKSPWGAGRPGWHIECSVMSAKYLGQPFDIHGGGSDLIFPHHENEIAQSEADVKQPFVKYWLHNGFVTMGKDKMSKSLGNVFTVREFLKLYPAESLRLLVLSGHYRSPIEFSESVISDTVKGLERFYKTACAVSDYLSLPHDTNKKPSVGQKALEKELVHAVKELEKDFMTAMDDDFNSSLAIGHIFEVVRKLNKFLRGGDVVWTPQGEEICEAWQFLMKRLAAILGVFEENPQIMMDNLRVQQLSPSGMAPEEINKLIKEREEARKNKNWRRADEIRDYLIQRNIILEDTSKGTLWKVRK